MEPISRSELLRYFRRVAQNNGWGLLALAPAGATEDDMADAMAARLAGWAEVEGHPTVTDELLRAAARAAYSPVMHAALNSSDYDVQTCALREIWAYISPIAQRFLDDPGEAGAAANRALTSIWQYRDRVRQPDKFLSWCGCIVSREAKAELRRLGRHPLVPIEGEDEQLDEREAFRPQDGGEQPALMQGALATDGSYDAVERQSVVAHLEELVRRCLRSPLQREVAVGLLLHDLDAHEVALRLGITPAYVHVLSFRAKEGLRRCRVLLDELGASVGAQAERGRHAA